MRTVFARLAGFTFLPLLSLITPLFMLPVISRIVGDGGWASAIAGQAIGTFGATVIMWGWNVDGPVRAARAATQTAMGNIYNESLRTRLALGFLILPAVSVIAFLIGHDGHRWDGVVMAWTTALAGFSPAWVGIGQGKPMLLALYDTLPRFLATCAAIPVLLLSGQVLWYAVLLLVATILSLLLFQRRLGSPARSIGAPPGDVVNELKRQSGTALISFSGNAYAATPAPIATLTTPATMAAGFASADTIYRFGLFSAIALGNALQGWTLERNVHNRRSRHVSALVAHIVLGVLGLGLFVALGPEVSALFFGDAVKTDRLTSFFFGLAFLFLSAGTPLIRNLLIPAGRQRIVLTWTVISAVVGLGTMLVLGSMQFVAGVALGMAISEAILFAGLLAPALSHLKSAKEPSTI